MISSDFQCLGFIFHEGRDNFAGKVIFSYTTPGHGISMYITILVFDMCMFQELFRSNLRFL